ncbi:type I glyceraldehyde-3-phosphate dehydrogenase [bacterium (Candidatus Howlettbacteria) CG_4_10_14_0_8_um_filter_40_9]|nr:MAG: type I glyceraldehyde-3-phosphate dehydrogenase [bacterium (Candidatus Howlettbacteria) CG_4_10_14_0_8_um_filter_40_9]
MNIVINGFGRVGRQVFKIITEKYPKHRVVAINDLGDVDTLIHLLKHDSNYGTWDVDIRKTKKGLSLKKGLLKSRETLVFAEKDPANLPWKKLGVDLVVESTGFFTDGEKAKAHLEAGAKKVIISAPAKNQDKTIVIGVNEKEYNPKKHNIISMASCTTNSLAPMAKVILDNFGIKKGLMTTVHSYTNDQRILDLPHEDLRRARAAALNIVPTTTGAAKAISEVIPQLKNKLDGIALRVPTPVVSITDLTIETGKNVTEETLKKAFKKAAAGEMKGILLVSEEELTSMDFKANPHSSIVDIALTRIIGGKFVKVFSWYDNEWGYSNRVADLADLISKKL